MGIALKEFESIPLAILLEDRDTSKFVRATVRNATGAQISGSPFNVPHLSNGLYFSIAVGMPNTKNIIVEYDIFDDAGFTIESDHEPDGERFDLDELASIIDAMIKADLKAEISDLSDLVAQISDTNVIKAVITETDLSSKIDEDETLKADISDENLEGDIKC